MTDAPLTQNPPPPVSPPAGWYPDAGDPQALRWWDGSGWTAETRAVSAPTHVGQQPAVSPFAAGSPVADGQVNADRRQGWAPWMIAVVISAVVVVLAIGAWVALSLVASPQFSAEQRAAQDSVAKADVSTLAVAIATYWIDGTGMPAVTQSGDRYSVDGAVIDYTSSPNVVLGGATGSSSVDWCVYVTNPEGDIAVTGYQYSAMRGLEAGHC